MPKHDYPLGRSVSFPNPIPVGLLSVFNFHLALGSVSVLRLPSRLWFALGFQLPSHRWVLLPDYSFCCARVWLALRFCHTPSLSPLFRVVPGPGLKATLLPPPFPFRDAPPFGFTSLRSDFSLRFFRPCRRILRRISTALSYTSTGLLGVSQRSHLSHMVRPLLTSARISGHLGYLSAS